MEIIIKHHLIPNGIIRTVEPKKRPSLIEWMKEFIWQNPQIIKQIHEEIIRSMDKRY